MCSYNGIKTKIKVLRVNWVKYSLLKYSESSCLVEKNHWWDCYSKRDICFSVLVSAKAKQSRARRAALPCSGWGWPPWGQVAASMGMVPTRGRRKGPREQVPLLVAGTRPRSGPNSFRSQTHWSAPPARGTEKSLRWQPHVLLKLRSPDVQGQEDG